MSVEPRWPVPRGWAWTSIESIAEVTGGGTPSAHDPSNFSDNGGIPWVTPADLTGYGDTYITRGRRNLSDRGYKSSSAKLLPAGAVLFTSRAPIGYCAIAANPIATNQGFKSLTLFGGISGEFTRHYLKWSKPYLESLASGTTFLEISGSKLQQVPFPLPPLAEQKRIVAKLDALNAKCTRVRTELTRIETLVSRYKQAVLSKAFSGELTEYYRNQRSILRKLESAPSYSKQNVPRKLKVKGATDIMKGIHLPPLPTGWNWVENHSLAQNNANAICAGPFGTIFKAKDFREKGVPIIFLRHVGPGEYRTHKPGYMDEKVWLDLHQPYSVFGGELLVTKLGDPPGAACIYPVNAGTAMVTPDVIKMSVDENSSHPAFLMHYFNSPTAKDMIKELAFGLTRLRVDLAMFKTFPVPLPSVEEQHEIVRRIESAFAQIDRLAAEAKGALALVGKLDEAILAKAFRGELVPQDENDEPAEQLLERIRAERIGAPKAKRGRRA